MNCTYDLVVIGSGPAGSAAALTAAKAGLSVALLDKSPFPRDKLCGGGVTGRSVRYLNDIFDIAPSDALFLQSTQVRLAFEGRAISEQHTPTPLYMTMRRDFDAALHHQASAAGVQVFAPVRIAEIDLDAVSVTLADGRRLTGAAMIGADGANSAVARALFGRPFNPSQIGFGLEIEMDRALLDDNTTEIDLGAANWGYGWVFPKHDSITLGVGGIHALNPDMKSHFRTYLARHAPKLAETGDFKCKGAFLPFGAYRKVPGRGRILLAGDAAGLVDPITGEGIAWAMKSGQFAGQAVVEALAQGGPDQAMAAYMQRVSFIHREIEAAHRIRTLIYSRPVRPFFPRAVERNPTMSRTYLRLLAGDLDYADLGYKVMFRLMRRLGGSLLYRRAA
ncbi:geranylgeranyl reductase family protein [Roseinatronobacter thiooxidans]|uniref:Geranylgeranyl reductase family protein n=1 Tax=Roseinatronobacter thiooxidans TaxID=121821 RepID=A0A2W7R1S9_9RHOB|nr:geranylgeranyl reductase family protein [Roseinatronobacter thiooxidans]PZX48069.1 geranylgeranyl reductase family protein [Roseinatronobacter thiooxidans]